MLEIIFKILIFALTITFLLSWGYVKQQRKNEELLNQLYGKIRNKLVSELKKKEVLTKVEIENIIKGTKASLFWSKNKIQVTNPKLITKNIINDMIKEGLIIEVGPKKYKLK